MFLASKHKTMANIHHNFMEEFLGVQQGSSLGNEHIHLLVVAWAGQALAGAGVLLQGSLAGTHLVIL